MAEQIAYDEWLAIGGYDLSGVSSAFGGERSADLEEFACFPEPTVTSAGPPYKKRLFGAESATISNTGYLDAAINLAAAEAAIGASPAVTKGDGRALGSSVLMFVGRQGSFNYGGEVGKVIPFGVEIASDGLVADGALFEFGPKTTTGNGTSRTMAAVTAGKVLVLHAHVVAISGTSTPSITIIHETSAIGDYTDAVTKHTFTAFTALGAQRAVKTAAISDLHHRFRWTISGTDPSFLIRLAAGIR